MAKTAEVLNVRPRPVDVSAGGDGVDHLDDFVTHDLLTERLAFHEKAVWMLRAIVAE